MNKENDTSSVSFRAERATWFDFVSQIKKNRTTIWQVLKPLIQNYIKQHGGKNK